MSIDNIIILFILNLFHEKCKIYACSFIVAFMVVAQYIYHHNNLSIWTHSQCWYNVVQYIQCWYKHVCLTDTHSFALKFLFLTFYFQLNVLPEPRYKTKEKVDVFCYGPYSVSLSIWNEQWRIAMLTKYSKSTKQYNYLIKLDGFSLGQNKITRREKDIFPLNTHTIIHSYLCNSSNNIICNDNKFKACPICQRKCCISCNIYKLSNDSYCGKCIDNAQFKQMQD